MTEKRQYIGFLLWFSSACIYWYGVMQSGLLLIYILTIVVPLGLLFTPLILFYTIVKENFDTGLCILFSIIQAGVGIYMITSNLQ